MSERKEKAKRKNTTLGVIREESVNIRERYPEVMEKKAILLGQPETQGRYMHVDFAHMNFLLSVIKFKQCNSVIDGCRELWYHFWPYLSKLLVTIRDIESERDYTKELLEVEYKEHDKILRNYANTELERKLLLEFLKVHSLGSTYKEWKEDFVKTMADTKI